MCTGIQVTSIEGNTYWGRTQEFGFPMPMDGITIPRGYEVKGLLLSDVTFKYASMGCTLSGKDYNIDNVVMLMDGINENGLVGGTFYFGSGYHNYATQEEVEALGKLPFRGEEFVTWAIANCADVDELRERALSEVAICDTENELGAAQPQHYWFTDKTGKSIVIEPDVKGSFTIHDNKIGTMSNAPDFDYHVKNLNNYVGLTGDTQADWEMGNVTIPSSGIGSGLFGLPGDFTPQTRFVRATIFNRMSDAPSDDMAIHRVYNILNNFDIPYGLIKTGNALGKPDDLFVHRNQYSTAYNLNNLTLYVSPFENRRIQSLSLKDATENTKAIRYEIKKIQDIQEMSPIK
ncbi:linear amide C-N hydrolase [Vagococcus fessus]|uniref:Choloylglycine hydrolase/NAAA C-terminal domain-containing protein n=1 Tax=Vagococcus fessus TaxID=120370 RepID=A0A430A6H7_9ENTE|nr:linear amide C-N hydrolase [Vagococcus fessus]RSU02461.1 hypothetical protein CBF31_08820 [Vagococcus fessus]